MPDKRFLVDIIDQNLDPDRFRQQHWEGTFHDYLDMVAKNPRTARNAFQRIYDMIHHFGTEHYKVHRQDIIQYHFFSDPIGDGIDAVFGLDAALV